MDLPFTSDGCSGGMNYVWKLLFQDVPPWNQCCIEHDFAYWQGGNADQRLIADNDLMSCTVANGHRYFALLMWIAVRIGGMPWMPFGWTWGWGWTINRGYKEREFR